MPSMAALTAASFMRMKSVSVLSRSKTIARITRVAPRSGSLGGRAYHAAEADLAVVDAQVEAARRVVADPGLVGDWRAVASVVGQREQHALSALAARGKRFHPKALPLPIAGRDHT